ncbi:hypothetical protein [Streptomyces radiopugnans]|uniref:hypothetical protein n=1 Tax=Streptomyces radiopugnans TaxID=403935 RepID=UPI003F1BE4EC
MNLRSKLATAAAAATIPLGLGMGATPAAAETTTPASEVGVLAGNCGHYVSCTSLSNGTLYIKLSDGNIGYNMNIRTEYKKTGGSTISAKFGYSLKGSNYWSGSYSISSGQTKGHTWANAYPTGCPSAVGLLLPSGQSTFQTPPVTSCS